MVGCCSHVWLFGTTWTVAHQASLSMGFSKQGYWSGLLCLPPGDHPNPRITPSSLSLLHWQEDSLPLSVPGKPYLTYQFSSVQSLSRVRLFATPWIAAHQASLSITDSQSIFKLMSIESVMSSSHVILSVIPYSSCPQSFPASGSFPVSQLFKGGGQSIGVSASASVLPMNIQDWFPLGWTSWISLQS